VIAMDGLKITEGLTEKQIDQLINYSNTDPDVKKFTSDSKRFASKMSFKDWIQNNKVVIYALVGTADNLIGVSWVDIRPLPNAEYKEDIDPAKYQTTSGIRIYGDFRGKGLAADFYQQILSKISGGIWEQISSENIASIKLHEKLGFKIVSNPDQNNKVIMVR
jgi:RimJ/RimL family protein N-acetyltransferase